jgi:hypothetical protein
MNLHKLAFAGALLAFASPIAALAQQNNTAETAAINAISSDHQAQVRNVLSLLSTKQIDAGTAAVQIDAVLSDDETKAILAQAAKAHSDQTDAGAYLASLVAPPSQGK